MEFYIVLSDKCNFSCSHCLNSSGPKAARYRVTDADRVAIIEHINLTDEIKAVHFSGGEPTLHIDLMEAIQKGVTRPVTYAITTNAWLGRNPENLFGRVRLDSVIVSYDKFHSPFVTIDVVEKFIVRALELKIPVTLSWVYEKLSEVAEAKRLLKDGVTFHPIRLIASGRQSDTEPEFKSDGSLLRSRCPSFDRSVGEFEKTIFIPGRGETPCCGPLAFDDLGDRELLFTPLGAQNPLATLMRRATFEEQFRELGLRHDHMSFLDRCAPCTFIYGRHTKSALPSKFDILRIVKKDGAFLHPISSTLPHDDVLAMNGSCKVTYILTGEPVTVSQGQGAPLLASRDWQEGDDELLWTHKVGTYGKINASRMERTDLEISRRTMPDYLKLARFKRLYIKNGRVVGALLVNLYDPHPVLKVPTIHVGYLGYDADLISRNEAQWLKQEWIRQIAEWNTDRRLVSASIDWFNDRSLALAAKCGLAIKYIRMERRNE